MISKDLGIKEINADILIPPAIKHEIGADALAMMLKSNFLDNKEISLVTDYGTNAEMALKVGDKIFTGSAASGPHLKVKRYLVECLHLQEQFLTLSLNLDGIP